MVGWRKRRVLKEAVEMRRRRRGMIRLGVQFKEYLCGFHQLG